MQGAELEGSDGPCRYGEGVASLMGPKPTHTHTPNLDFQEGARLLGCGGGTGFYGHR